LNPDLKTITLFTIHLVANPLRIQKITKRARMIRALYITYQSHVAFESGVPLWKSRQRGISSTIFSSETSKSLHH
jgi:hypothetical protein